MPTMAFQWNLFLNCLIVFLTVGIFSFVNGEDDLIRSYCMKPVDQNYYPACTLELRLNALSRQYFNATCLEGNVFLVKRESSHRVQSNVLSYKNQSISERGSCESGRWKCNNGQCILSHYHCDKDPDCTDKSDELGCPDMLQFASVSENEIPPTAKIVCRASFPMDLDFQGVGTLDYFTILQNRDKNNYTLQAQILLIPEATGKYIIRGLYGPPEAETSIFIFSERGRKPYLIGTGRESLEAITTSENKTYIPCVASDLTANVTLFEMVDNGWSKMNGITYNRQDGFVLDSSTSASEYRCYSTDIQNISIAETDYVTIKKGLPNRQQVKTVTINLHPTNGSTAVCYSTQQNGTNLKFVNIFARNPIEAKLSRQCLEKGSPYCGVENSYHQVIQGRKLEGVPCPEGSSNCLWITSPHRFGLFYCETGVVGDFASQTYFTGMDNKTYTNATGLPSDVLIQGPENGGKLPLYAMAYYKFLCNNVEFPLLTVSKNPLLKYKDGSIEELTYESKKVTLDMDELICEGVVWDTNSSFNSTVKLNITVKPCAYSEFACKSGGCISANYRCDWDRDCPDSSDEENCEFRCRYGGFRCGNSTICITTTAKCNNIKDCLNGEDETAETCANTTCLSSQWKCSSGQCISSSLMCNGFSNCLDKSDEANCSGLYPQFLESETGITFFPSSQLNELICEVEERPVGFKPTLSWWRRGYVRKVVSEPGRIWVGNNGLKLALRFENVTQADGGEWICLAVNALKNMSRVFVVTVNTTIPEPSRMICPTPNIQPTEPTAIISTTERTHTNEILETSREGDNCGCGSDFAQGVGFAFLIMSVLALLVLTFFGWRYYTRPGRSGYTAEITHINGY